MTPAGLLTLEWPREPASSHAGGFKEGCGGFTIIELLVVFAMLATLVALGAPVYGNALDKARVTRTIADIRFLEREIQVFQLFVGTLPDSLVDVGRDTMSDPYGNPYQYLNIATAGKGKGQLRKDKFLVPLNSDFDLYSKGKDGNSQPPLTAKTSQDDIIRANDGGFVGLASQY